MQIPTSFSADGFNVFLHLVGEAGVEPAMYLTSQIYSLVPSPTRHTHPLPLIQIVTSVTLYCDGYLVGKFMILIIHRGKAVLGELIEIRDILDLHFRGRVGLLFNEPLYCVHMAVVDMRVRNDVDKLSRLESCGFCEHYEQRRILADVPVVRSEHVLAALVEYRVEPVPGDVERHGIGAGSQPHFAEVGVIVGVGHDTAAVRVVLQVVQHLVHLIEISLGIVVLHAELIAVRLADGAVSVRPGVPDMGRKVSHTVGFLLVYPEYLINGGAIVNPAKRHYRELLLEVIAIHDAEFLYRVRGSTILPVRADVAVLIGNTVFYDAPAVLYKQFISVTHIYPFTIMMFQFVREPAAKHESDKHLAAQPTFMTAAHSVDRTRALTPTVRCHL